MCDMIHKPFFAIGAHMEVAARKSVSNDPSRPPTRARQDTAVWDGENEPAVLGEEVGILPACRETWRPGAAFGETP